MKFVISRFIASWIPLAFMLTAASAHADEPDLRVAETAFHNVDYTAVVDILLPVYDRGELKDSRGLFLLGMSCRRRDPCKDRAGKIIREAADAGDIQAMINLANSLDTRFDSLRFRDLDLDRVTAYRYALAARNLASDDHQKEQAETVLAQVGRKLSASERSRLTPQPVAVPAIRTIAADTETAAAATVEPGWLDTASLRMPQRYRPGPNVVKVGEDHPTEEGDAGVADEIDADSVIRHGDEIQYIYSGMDTVVLIQASCQGGAPTLIWEADPYDAAADGSLTFHPQARQPIPQERRWIDYYGALTRKACSL